MIKNKTTIDDQEIAKFTPLRDEWWNKDGAFKTLHDINPARLEFIAKYTNLSQKKVLDVGCGGGILCEAMALQGGNIHGIDADEAAISAALLHAKPLTIQYRHSPIECYEEGPFDIITCMEMLEHVQDPKEVIKHCARLLAPGGFLFLSTINRTFQAYATAVLAAEYVLKLLPMHTHEYDKFIKPAELAAAVRACGFKVLGLQGLTYNPWRRTASLQNSVSVNYLMCCSINKSSLLPG